MPRLHLQLLGAPRIELDGKPIEVDTRKAIALAAYLVLSPGPQSRDRLALMFWPEADEAKAHAALRRTLSVLNKALDGVGLEIDRDAVTLSRGPEVRLDVDEFHACLAECAGHGHALTETCPRCHAPLQAAALLYRDDFMAGFSLRDSSAFDDWQFFQSESLRRELSGVLERLAASVAQPDAAAYARRWLRLDPIHEPAHRQLMTLYARTGQRAAALRQYQECARILDAELGVPPLAETTALFEAIRDGKFDDRRPTHDDRPPPHAHRPVPAAGESPLIGRAREMALLQTSIESILADGRLVVIEGEAGIGKTRLADSFLRSLSMSSASARCYEGEQNLAYGPFVELLQSAFRNPAFASRLAQIDPFSLTEAARLAPELAAHLPAGAAAPPLTGPGAQSRFFEGVLQVLMGLADGQPAVLFLDDAQWMDEASLDLLTYCVRRLRGRRLLIVLAWRTELVPAGHRLRPMLAEAQRGGLGQGLALGRLSQAEVSELVRAALPKQPADAWIARLFSETEGLPLFVMEYLAGLPADSTQAEWTLPAGVRGLLQTRLDAVDETARQLLGAAAVIGRSFDFDTLQAVSGRGLEETVAGLETLMGLGLVAEVGERDGALQYDFSHDKLRALVYDESSLARRRLLHRRAAEALAARARGRAPGALAGQIAFHYRLSGDGPTAAHYYKAAGDHARTLYANADALAHYNAALALGHPEAAGLHESIGDLQTLAGDYGLALKSYEAAAALDGAVSLGELEHKLGNVYARRGDAALAVRHFEAALRTFGPEGPPGLRARVLADWSLVAHHRGQSDEALKLAGQAHELAEAGDDRRALAQARNILGILATSAGDYAAAHRHLEGSLTLAEALGDGPAQAAALNNLALACRAADQVDEAIELTERALRLCASQGDRHREAALHNNLADLLHTLGRGEAAMTHLKRAVALFAEVGLDPAGENAWQPEIWKLTEW